MGSSIMIGLSATAAGKKMVPTRWPVGSRGVDGRWRAARIYVYS
jgi:hypothetical protein